MVFLREGVRLQRAIVTMSSSSSSHAVPGALSDRDRCQTAPSVEASGHWVWGRVEAWTPAPHAALQSIVLLEETSSSSLQSAERSEAADASGEQHVRAKAKAMSCLPSSPRLAHVDAGAAVAPPPAAPADREASTSFGVGDAGSVTGVDALLEAAFGDLWSRGSRKHARGSCTVCSFFMGESGCDNGTECMFCHIPHASAGRKKLGMRRRLKVKLFAEALEAAYRDDLDKFRVAAAAAGSRCPFLEGLLNRKLESLTAERLEVEQSRR